MLKHADTDEAIARCYPVMAQLRPHVPRADFVARVRLQMEQGFRLAFLEVTREIVAVAGYRVTTNLFMGKNLYVDDLVTAESSRSRGYGKKLLDDLRTLARDDGCLYLHLDSGTQRLAAHKFYLREGLSITSFHFSEKID